MADAIDEMLDSVKAEYDLQFPHRTYWKVNPPKDEYGQSSKERVLYGEANLVSSQCANGMHAPAIDIDLPCRLVESQTEGHFHLYIDKQMPWEEYCKLLDVMMEIGIVEPKYVEMCKKDGRSYLRLRPNDPPKTPPPTKRRIVRPRPISGGYGTGPSGYGY